MGTFTINIIVLSALIGLIPCIFADFKDMNRKINETRKEIIKINEHIEQIREEIIKLNEHRNG